MVKRERPGEEGSADSDAKAFGRRLKAARLKARLSVEAAAQAADISKNHLYVLERGESVPMLATIGRLARAYGISRECLLKPKRRAARK